MKYTNNTNNVLNLFADAVNGDPEIAPMINLPCLDDTGFNAEFDSVRRDSTNELISRDDLQTIWRGDNGAYLGHAKGRYHIVQNASLFSALNAAAKNTLNAREPKRLATTAHFLAYSIAYRQCARLSDTLTEIVLK